MASKPFDKNWSKVMVEASMFRLKELPVNDSSGIRISRTVFDDLVAICSEAATLRHQLANAEYSLKRKNEGWEVTAKSPYVSGEIKAVASDPVEALNIVSAKLGHEFDKLTK